MGSLLLRKTTTSFSASKSPSLHYTLLSSGNLFFQSMEDILLASSSSSSSSSPFPPWPSLAYPLRARCRSFLMALEWQYTDTDNDGIFILQTSGGDYLSVKSVRQGLVGVWTVVDLGFSTDRDQAVLMELVSEYL